MNFLFGFDRLFAGLLSGNQSTDGSHRASIDAEKICDKINNITSVLPFFEVENVIHCFVCLQILLTLIQINKKDLF